MDTISKINEMKKKVPILDEEYPKNEKDIDVLYDVFKGQKVSDVNKLSPNVLYCMALVPTSNYLEYLRLAADMGHIRASYEYARFFCDSVSEKIKYYTISYNGGYMKALHRLLVLYQVNDRKKFMELLKDGVSKNDGHCLRIQAYQFTRVEDDGLREKFLIKAIDAGNKRALTDLGTYYKSIGKERDACRLLLTALKRGLSDALGNLIDIYSSTTNDPDDIFFDFLETVGKDQEIIKKLPMTLRMLAILHLESIEVIDLDIKYQPDASGYQKAKEDFIERVKTLTHKN